MTVSSNENLWPIDSEQLLSYHLGLKSKTVELQSFHSDWALAYKLVEKSLLQALNPDNLIQLEFIGSASLPGLPSKPILDILVEFKDEDLFMKDMSSLEVLGFVNRGDGIGR